MTKRESDANKSLLDKVSGISHRSFRRHSWCRCHNGYCRQYQSGGRSALSGLSRVAVLLVVLLLISDLTAMIPLAVLSGIAFKVGLDIIDGVSYLEHILYAKAVADYVRCHFADHVVDLIIAVAVGVFIANLLLIERLTAAALENVIRMRRTLVMKQVILKETNGSILIFALGGTLFFGLAKAISRQRAVLSIIKH